MSNAIGDSSQVQLLDLAVRKAAGSDCKDHCWEQLMGLTAKSNVVYMTWLHCKDTGRCVRFVANQANPNLADNCSKFTDGNPPLGDVQQINSGVSGGTSVWLGLRKPSCL
eukprot:scaffold107890_cov24-Tisochrysis_lutea.AAC.2